MPRTFEFRIDYPVNQSGKTAWNRRFGLNAYYAGKNWAVRRKDAEYWHALTKSAIRKADRNPAVFTSPVIIEGYFNDNLDCSNHAAEIKMIEDGMKGLIISDDSRRYVRGIAMYFHDEPYILIRVTEL